MFIIGLFGIICALTSCEKDESKVILNDPTPPTIVSLPDLTLLKENELDTLVFIGTPLDAGVQLSTIYFLEACEAGNNFVDVIRLSSGGSATVRLTVKFLNDLFLKSFPFGEPISVDFRLRAQLIVDAGAGAPGSRANPIAYSSEIINAEVTLYEVLEDDGSR